MGMESLFGWLPSQCCASRNTESKEAREEKHKALDAMEEKLLDAKPSPTTAKPKSDVAYVDMGGALKGMDDLKAMRARLTQQFPSTIIEQVQHIRTSARAPDADAPAPAPSPPPYQEEPAAAAPP